MKINKTKMLLVVLAVAGLYLTVVAEGEERDVSEVLTGISQDSPLYARMCYQRGLRLYRGKGCDRDLPAAVEAFRQAAEMEYAEAEDVLATCYHNGHGVSGRLITVMRMQCSRWGCIAIPAWEAWSMPPRPVTGSGWRRSMAWAIRILIRAWMNLKVAGRRHRSHGS